MEYCLEFKKIIGIILEDAQEWTPTVGGGVQLSDNSCGGRTPVPEMS